MNEFRISKYDTAFRLNGIYQKEEWTSICDIGKTYGGNIFTYNDYICAENAYIRFIEEVCSILKIQFLKVSGLEDYRKVCKISDKQIIGIDEILNVSRDCLREVYWCRLESEQLFFHFGYDYYMYVGSKLSYSHIKNMADRCGLFVEKIGSPYKPYK